VFKVDKFQVSPIHPPSRRLSNKYVDSYLTCTSAKELWDALDEKFGVSDASSELYIMEQLFN
jgi:hypothetical protein